MRGPPQLLRALAYYTASPGVNKTVHSKTRLQTTLDTGEAFSSVESTYAIGILTWLWSTPASARLPPRQVGHGQLRHSGSWRRPKDVDFPQRKRDTCVYLLGFNDCLSGYRGWRLINEPRKRQGRRNNYTTVHCVYLLRCESASRVQGTLQFLYILSTMSSLEPPSQVRELPLLTK